MITKDLKISKLLVQYPNSLNVLLNISPHFSKLQNKFLRKALAGRVTIEQAASIAGVDLNNLLNELNGNGSATSRVSASLGDGEASEENSEFHISFNEEKIVTLDVRPILNSGKDPLQNILSKVKKLKPDEVLLIINSFEPIPLYSLLKKKGFSHHTKNESDIFKVYFYKTEEETDKISSEKSAENIDENDFENIVELDVSQLQPPEPMMKILENLNTIDDNSCLLVHHHREPHLLYPKLEERAYQAVCHKLGEDQYKILIFKKRL